MTLRREWPALLFVWLVGAAYAFSLSLSLCASTILPDQSDVLLALCLAASLFFTVLFYNRRTLLAGGIVLVFLALFALRALFALPEGEEETLFAQLSFFILYGGEYSDAFFMPIALAATLSISLTAVLHIRLRYGFYVLLILGLPVFLLPVVFGYKHSSSAALVFAFSVFALLVRQLHLHTLNQNTAPKKTRASARFTAALLPLCLVISIAAAYLPYPTGAAYNWSRTLDERRYGDLTAIDTFTGSSTLGGPLQQSDRFVLRAKAYRPLYLRSAVKEVYTGQSWTALPEPALLYAQKNGTYSAYPDQWILRAHTENMLTAYPSRMLYVSTDVRMYSRLFSPDFRRTVQLSSPHSLYMDQYGVLHTAEALPQDFSYMQTYLDVYDAEDAFGLLVAQFADAARFSETADNPLIQNVEKTYTQLPDTLPAAVRTLAQTLTADTDNRYLQARALADYLSENYAYTLSPSPVPAGRDFVDYFLFEGKEGYCVYYATAFVVMARAAGIPARYVEGYLMPSEMDDEGWAVVTSRDAHAWAEIFIPALGWIRIEATAGFDHVTVPYGEEQPPVQPGDPGSTSSKPHTEDPVSTPPVQSDDPRSTDGMPATENPVSTPPTSPPGTKNRALFSWPDWVVPLAVSVCIASCAALILWRIAAYRRRQRIVDTLDSRRGLAVYFQRIVALLSCRVPPIGEAETVLQFAARAEASADFGQNRATLSELAASYNAASYSPLPVPETARQQMRRCYHALDKAIRPRSVRFWMQRYLFARF